MKLLSTSRRFGQVLALVALSLLLLGPACDVFAHHPADAGAACCEELDSGAKAFANKAAASAGAPELPAPGPAVRAFVAPAFTFVPRILPGAGPSPLASYYARSARILR
jgi:hypothetical protein